MTNSVDHFEAGYSIFAECDNCGAVGEPTTDRTGDGDPILECPTCRARWKTDESRLIARCIASSSAARGVDSWAVEHAGYSASDWAELTDRDPTTVARNVRRSSE